jgi:hypothetical protein
VLHDHRADLRFDRRPLLARLLQRLVRICEHVSD